MELFLPSLLLFLIAVIVIAVLLPRMSPLIIVLLSAGLLGVGVYHHFNLFWDDYKQSTWQDQLRVFAPGIMLILIVLYVLYALLTVFTGGQVPVPSMPSVELPSAETATNVVTETINNALQAVMPTNNGRKNNGGNTGNNAGGETNRRNGNGSGNGNTSANESANKNKNKNGNNVTRSFLATI